MSRFLRVSLLAALVCFALDSGAVGAANVAREFPARILGAHNAVRAETGMPPLAWDPALAEGAATYAVQLAVTNSFQHSDRNARRGIGENLWMGTRGAYSYESMVGSWASERRYFVPGLFPAVSRSGNWQDVAHYTQIVWPTTTRVGCALASNASADFLVCRYSPAGNIDGRPVPFSASNGTGIRAR